MVLLGERGPEERNKKWKKDVLLLCGGSSLLRQIRMKNDDMSPEPVFLSKRAAKKAYANNEYKGAEMKEHMEDEMAWIREAIDTWREEGGKVTVEQIKTPRGKGPNTKLLLGASPNEADTPSTTAPLAPLSAAPTTPASSAGEVSPTGAVETRSSEANTGAGKGLAEKIGMGFVVGSIPGAHSARTTITAAELAAAPQGLQK